MKVHCDVCSKAHATLMCCADEAALCADCDYRIHGANKLASKHQRISLIYLAPDDLPCCDICQDKGAFFFCLEDRALLCRNCDYSIHSAKNLAAKHKRFLVPGVRVGLQGIATTDTSDSVQTYSHSSLSSPSTQISQLSYPTKSVRVKPASSNTTRSSTPIPQKLPPYLREEPVKLGREKSFRNVMSPSKIQSSQKVPSLKPPPYSREEPRTLDRDRCFQNVLLSSSTQSSQQVPSSRINREPLMKFDVKRSSVDILPASSMAQSSEQISSASITKEHQAAKQSIGVPLSSSRVQSVHIPPSSSRVQSSQQVSSSNVLHTKSVSSNVPRMGANQPVHVSSGRQQVDWGMRHSTVDVNPHPMYTGAAMSCQIGGGSYMRRGSISEYLTETIPGWKVDELLSLSDMETIYNFDNTGSSRAGAPNIGDMDWPCDYNAFDDSVPCGVAAEVPSIPSPPTLSGIPRSVKPFGYGKALKQQDLDLLSGYDDALVVPDIGGVSSPLTSSPSSPPLKRRRTFLDF